MGESGSGRLHRPGSSLPGSRSSINRSDPMRCCPFCNHENPVGIRLCPNCGATPPESIGSAQPLEEWEQEVRALLGEGQKIQAIKLYRERTGAGLRQAKEAVE